MLISLCFFLTVLGIIGCQNTSTSAPNDLEKHLSFLKSNPFFKNAQITNYMIIKKNNDTSQPDCSKPGSFQTCNVNANHLSGGLYVGKRQTPDKPSKRQWYGNTANVHAGGISGGSYVGKRDLKEQSKRQWIGNTANVHAGSISGGSYVGKRDLKEQSKRQWIGNIANVHAGGISGGSYVGKRDSIVKRNVFNLLSDTPISGGSFSGQGNIMDGAGEMKATCGPSGCINYMG